METLTLSRQETATLIQHLAAMRDQMSPSSTERLQLDGLIIKIGVQRPHVTLARLEVFMLLRFVRQVRQYVQDELMALEERRRLGVDGRLELAWRQTDRDGDTLDGVIRRLWELTA